MSKLTQMMMQGIAHGALKQARIVSAMAKGGFEDFVTVKSLDSTKPDMQIWLKRSMVFEFTEDPQVVGDCLSTILTERLRMIGITDLNPKVVVAVWVYATTALAAGRIKWGVALDE